jgi:murein DD-endopeptidase MepM/ murein hydrolase activator NlpD
MKIINPVDKNNKISLGFGEYPMFLRLLLNKKNHDGIDFACPIGTEILNPFVGGKGTRVIFVGEEPSGWGKYVILRHVTANNNIYFGVFCHLSRTLKQAGALLRAEEVFALSGKSGVASGPHLHFGVYEAVNPTCFLK